MSLASTQLKDNQFRTVSAKVLDKAGKEDAHATMVWSSDEPTICSVQLQNPTTDAATMPPDLLGHTAYVVAHAPGETTVRATSGGVLLTIDVTVTPSDDASIGVDFGEATDL